MKYDKFDYEEMQVLEWCLFNALEFRINVAHFEGIREKLKREVNNELYERDERHWADK